jgi:membrane protease YdiL (CAAX protease family)
MLGASLGAIQVWVMAATALGLDVLIPGDLPSDLLLPGPFAALSVIALAVVTPVAEEIFFRGFVLRGFVNRWGVAPGIVLSAVVFAGLHFQPSVIVPVFITGLLLGWLYWHTGSIWPGIGVHAAQNLIATLGIVVGL